MSLKSLRDQLNVTGGKISEKEQEQLQGWMKGSLNTNDKCVDIYSIPMTAFIFEAVIRPRDNGLVIHLKNLAPTLRNPKFFDYATTFIRDRIGKFGTLDASFIGELDAVNKLNSLDLMFTQYYPALRGDMEFIKEHTAKIGKQLDDQIVHDLGDYALSFQRKR